MEFSINCMLITSDMEYLNSYLKYSFKVDDYYEDNNNHELEVLKVEEEYQESEEEEEDEESEDELEDFDSDDEENKNTLVQKIVYKIKGIKYTDNEKKCLNICCCKTTFNISNIEKRKKRCIICEEVLFEPLEHWR